MAINVENVKQLKRLKKKLPDKRHIVRDAANIKLRSAMKLQILKLF